MFVAVGGEHLLRLGYVGVFSDREMRRALGLERVRVHLHPADKAMRRKYDEAGVVHIHKRHHYIIGRTARNALLLHVAGEAQRRLIAMVPVGNKELLVRQYGDDEVDITLCSDLPEAVGHTLVVSEGLLGRAFGNRQAGSESCARHRDTANRSRKNCRRCSSSD